MDITKEYEKETKRKAALWKSRSETCSMYEDRKLVCHMCAENPDSKDFSHCPYSGKPIQETAYKRIEEKIVSLVGTMKQIEEKNESAITLIGQDIKRKCEEMSKRLDILEGKSKPEPITCEDIAKPYHCTLDFKCSKCGREYPLIKDNGFTKINYCPNCGAKNITE